MVLVTTVSSSLVRTDSIVLLTRITASLDAVVSLETVYLREMCVLGYPKAWPHARQISVALERDSGKSASGVSLVLWLGNAKLIGEPQRQIVVSILRDDVVTRLLVKHLHQLQLPERSFLDAHIDPMEPIRCAAGDYHRHIGLGGDNY